MPAIDWHRFQWYGVLAIGTAFSIGGIGMIVAAVLRGSTLLLDAEGLQIYQGMKCTKERPDCRTLMAWSHGISPGC